MDTLTSKIVESMIAVMTVRGMRGKPSNVLHQATCPVCGRTLVNVYRKDGVVKCRRCWEQEEQSERKSD